MTDWQLVRQAYEQSDESVAALCRRHSLHPTLLYRRMHKEGWHLRRPPGKSGAMKQKKLAPLREVRKEGGQKDKPQSALIERLYKAFDAQMQEFESRLTLLGGEGTTEKDARTLGILARTLEKLIELRCDEAGSEEPTTDKGTDIERLREELARRIERVCPTGEVE